MLGPGSLLLLFMTFFFLEFFGIHFRILLVFGAYHSSNELVFIFGPLILFILIL